MLSRDIYSATDRGAIDDNPCRYYNSGRRCGMNNPCYLCREREPGCHGKCAGYAAYRADRLRENALRSANRGCDMEYDIYKRGVSRGIQKRRNRP